MDNSNPSKRIHPLVAGAAIAVIVVSLTGVAAITGLLPNSHGSAAPAVEANSTPVATGTTAGVTPPANALVDSKKEVEVADMPAQSAPAEKPRTRTAQSSSSQSHRNYSSSQPPVAQAPVICSSCGRVESIQPIQHAAQPSGLGMVAGAVLGGVLGNQVGAGNGRKLATVAGAVGGGYAGNEVEKHNRATTSYQVRVRMEDGEIRTFPYAQQPGWSVGDRVKVVDGHLTSRS